MENIFNRPSLRKSVKEVDEEILAACQEFDAGNKAGCNTHDQVRRSEQIKNLAQAREALTKGKSETDKAKIGFAATVASGFGLAALLTWLDKNGDMLVGYLGNAIKRIKL